MIEFRHTVQDETGIHARPAGALVKMAKETDCVCCMKHGDKQADLSKIFAVMSLGVKCGDTVTVEVSGESEQETAEKLKKYMEENL